MKDERLGDKMPVNRNVKWGEMRAGSSHLSEEWHGMEPSSGHMSEKWVEQRPSTGHMSDKWVGIEAGESTDNKWHEMKQEKRIDPYSMAPDYDNRTVGMKPMAKIAPDNKRERRSEREDSGKTHEI